MTSNQEIKAEPVDPTIHLSSDTRFYILGFVVFAIVVAAAGWPMYSKWKTERDLEEARRTGKCLQYQIIGDVRGNTGECSDKN